MLGLRVGFLPDFPSPGAWLYRGRDEAECGVVHLIRIDRNAPAGLNEYLGDQPEEILHGSAEVDHLAFSATDLPAMLRRLRAEGVAWRERTVPKVGLRQLFVQDPCGVTIELNFPAAEARAIEASGASAD